MTLSVKRIGFDACKRWMRDGEKIKHKTDRYFSIVCVREGGKERIMIDQPEVGILGFVITAAKDGTKWLSQNKPEPGNIGYYQLAPTVQATKSNYQRVHGGTATPFLDFFLQEKGLLVNVEGSEQGDQFINKFNRNAKRIVPVDFHQTDDNERFIWLSAAEVKHKLRENYTINTDARDENLAATVN